MLRLPKPSEVAPASLASSSGVEVLWLGCSDILVRLPHAAPAHTRVVLPKRRVNGHQRPAQQPRLAPGHGRTTGADADVSHGLGEEVPRPWPTNRAFNQDSFIEYDGGEAHIGDKTYDYAGVPQGFCYLLVPKSRKFRELEKQDLEVNSGDADVSRLVLEQQVGETWRGVPCLLGGRTAWLRST
jgi:hypothetical protein